MNNALNAIALVALIVFYAYVITGGFGRVMRECDAISADCAIIAARLKQIEASTRETTAQVEAMTAELRKEQDHE